MNAELGPGLPVHVERRLLGSYVDGEEVGQHWEVQYIIWSHVLAFTGAYVAFTTTMYMKQVTSSRWYWIMLVQAGLSLGGSTIWSMHFVGMRALSLWGGKESGAEERIDINFEPVLTVSSAMVAWMIATCALHTAIGRDFSNVTVRRFSRARSTAFSQNTMEFVSIMPVRRIALSSVMLASAVCAMHYMGMLSQSGNFTMSYNVGIILVSAVVAVVVSFAGLAIFFLLLDSLVYRTVSAGVVSVAVNGMHYCGMASATYYVHTSALSGPWGETSVAWHLNAELVMVSILLVDLTLMAATGYYVEVLETVRKREGEEFERELRYKSYINSADELMRRAKVMRYPMCLVRYDTFVKLGKLVPHEVLRDSSRLLYVNTPSAALKRKKKDFIVFFSHEWLSKKLPDPKNRQFQDMLQALRSLSAMYRVRVENMCVWVDYCSIPQESPDQQQLAIDSLSTYATVCSAFVVIAPQFLHVEKMTPCNFMTYSKRCWCRLEIFCSVLSGLRLRSSSSLFVPAAASEGEEEEDFAGDASEVLGSSALNQLPEHHRVFLVVDDQLQCLNLFSKRGHLRQDYEELLFVFKGELECCSCGHVDSEGKKLACDKEKVVEALSGCYGSMLNDLRTLRRSPTDRSTGTVNEPRRVIAEHIVKLRHQIFPAEFFDTRIEAMHERVEGRATRRSIVGSNDGDEGSSTDENPEPADEMPQRPSKRTSNLSSLEEDTSQTDRDDLEVAEEGESSRWRSEMEDS